MSPEFYNQIWYVLVGVLLAGLVALGPCLLAAYRRARLRREAEALARLDHPSICPVLEAQIEGERPYLAMRLIEGESLAADHDRVAANGAVKGTLTITTNLSSTPELAVPVMYMVRP